MRDNPVFAAFCQSKSLGKPGPLSLTSRFAILQCTLSIAFYILRYLVRSISSGLHTFFYYHDVWANGRHKNSLHGVMEAKENRVQIESARFSRRILWPEERQRDIRPCREEVSTASGTHDNRTAFLSPLCPRYRTWLYPTSRSLPPGRRH